MTSKNVSVNAYVDLIVLSCIEVGLRRAYSGSEQSESCDVGWLKQVEVHVKIGLLEVDSKVGMIESIALSGQSNFVQAEHSNIG